MDTIEIGSLEKAASRIALGTWALDAAAMHEIDTILVRHIATPVGPEFIAPPATPSRRAVA